MSAHDESNPVLKLATRAGNMAQDLVRLGLPTVSSRKSFPERRIVNALLPKIVWSSWLDNLLFF